MQNITLYQYVLFYMFFDSETKEIKPSEFWKVYNNCELKINEKDYYVINKEGIDAETVKLYKDYHLDIDTYDVVDKRVTVFSISKTLNYKPSDEEKENIKQESKNKLINDLHWLINNFLLNMDKLK